MKSVRLRISIVILAFGLGYPWVLKKRARLPDVDSRASPRLAHSLTLGVFCLRQNLIRAKSELAKPIQLRLNFCVFASVGGLRPQVEAKTKMEGKAIALLVGLYTKKAFNERLFRYIKTTHQQQSNRALARFFYRRWRTMGSSSGSRLFQQLWPPRAKILMSAGASISWARV